MIRTEGEGVPQEVEAQGTDRPLNGKALLLDRAVHLLLLRQFLAEVQHRVVGVQHRVVEPLDGQVSLWMITSSKYAAAYSA